MYDLEKDRQMFEYHSVFASALALYINLKKELDSAHVTSSMTSNKRNEALSILRSCYGYAVMLRPNAQENKTIPKAGHELVKYMDERMRVFRDGCNDPVEAFYLETVSKMELAGLTANYEKNMTSRMNIMLNKINK